MRLKVRKNTRNLFRGTTPSVWNFWKDGVSSSLLSLFLQCREQARLELVEGWRSRSEPFYFAYGKCGHWILEQARCCIKPPDEHWLNAMLKRFDKLWLRDVGKATSSQREQQERVYAFAQAQMPVYFKRWAGDWPKKQYPRPTKTPKPVLWVGTEQKFKIPYRFSDGTETVVFGTRDGVFEDAKKRLWLQDSKFRSMIDDDVITETLPFDLQQMLYLWAAQQEGTKLCGTVLDVVRRPGIRDRKGESLKSLSERIAVDVSDPKRWDHYFTRYGMDVTQNEIREWGEKQLAPLMEDVRRWWDGTGPHYLNPNALVSKYGRCAMYAIIVRGNTVGHYKRTNVTDYQQFLG